MVQKKRVVIEQWVAEDKPEINWINVPGYIKEEKEIGIVTIYRVTPISKEDIEKLKPRLEQLGYYKFGPGQTYFNIRPWGEPGEFFVREKGKKYEFKGFEGAAKQALKFTDIIDL